MQDIGLFEAHTYVHLTVNVASQIIILLWCTFQKYHFTLTMSSLVDWQFTAAVTSNTLPSCPTASTMTGRETGWLDKMAVFINVLLCSCMKNNEYSSLKS